MKRKDSKHPASVLRSKAKKIILAIVLLVSPVLFSQKALAQSLTVTKLTVKADPSVNCPSGERGVEMTVEIDVGTDQCKLANPLVGISGNLNIAIGDGPINVIELVFKDGDIAGNITSVQETPSPIQKASITTKCNGGKLTITASFCLKNTINIGIQKIVTNNLKL